MLSKIVRKEIEWHTALLQSVAVRALSWETGSLIVFFMGVTPTLWTLLTTFCVANGTAGGCSTHGCTLGFFLLFSLLLSSLFLSSLVLLAWLMLLQGLEEGLPAFFSRKLSVKRLPWLVCWPASSRQAYTLLARKPSPMWHCYQLLFTSLHQQQAICRLKPVAPLIMELC